MLSRVETIRGSRPLLTVSILVRSCSATGVSGAASRRTHGRTSYIGVREGKLRMLKRPKDFCRDCFRIWESANPGGVTLPKARPTPHPGPRCVTHWREEKKRRKAVNHERHVRNTYGLADGEYDLLFKRQLGTCAICLRATGATRQLSVDHDHKTGEVRGLLCRPCNNMLGHARDSDMFFYRAARYLQQPPARGILRREAPDA